MPTVLSAIDLTAPDAQTQLLAASEALNARRAQAFQALDDVLVPEQRPLLLTLLSPAEERERATAARLTLKAVDPARAVMEEARKTGLQEQLKAERLARHEALNAERSARAELERLRAQQAPPPPSPKKRENLVQQHAAQQQRLTSQIANQNREIRDLKAQLLQALGPQQPAPPSPPTSGPQRFRVRPADEVITRSPFSVEVAARHIEEFVRRHGTCSKSDISAALAADLRPHLPAAYRHLQASCRVRISGNTLSAV